MHRYINAEKNDLQNILKMYLNFHNFTQNKRTTGQSSSYFQMKINNLLTVNKIA